MTLRVSRGEPATAGPVPFYHHWRWSQDGGITLSFARESSGYRLRFPDLADFVLSCDARDVRCTPCSSTPAATLRHLFLNQVLPLALSQLGKLVLHASTVVAPQGAVALVGRAGQGKSTLAAVLARRGLPLLTDDCLVLEELEETLVAVSSYAGLRLWQDVVDVLFAQEPPSAPIAHYTPKKRLYPDEKLVPFCRDDVPLHGVFVLDPVNAADAPADAVITPLSPREAFLELMKYAYRMDVTDRDRLSRDLVLFARIAVRPLFFRLTFARDLSQLPALRDSLLAHLGQNGGSLNGGTGWTSQPRPDAVHEESEGQLELTKVRGQYR